MADGSRPELALLLEKNLQEMHLTINDNGRLKAGMVLTADQLDGTIAALCQIRSQMLPEIPADYSPGLEVHEIKGTHFNFDVDGATAELVFSLRDPGRGWLSQRFGARLLERMLKIASTAAGSATKQ
jgi:hypothetical protein